VSASGPSGRQELVGLDTSTFVEFAWMPDHAVVQGFGPDDVAVAFDDGVSGA